MHLAFALKNVESEGYASLNERWWLGNTVKLNLVVTTSLAMIRFLALCMISWTHTYAVTVWHALSQKSELLQHYGDFFVKVILYHLLLHVLTFLLWQSATMMTALFVAV
jgi:hypothetical protein